MALTLAATGSTTGTACTLAETAQRAREAYAQHVAGCDAAMPWWSTVIITAGSQRQAERYRAEIGCRLQDGTLPAGVQYLVVADLDDMHIGSGGATLNALHALAAANLATAAVDTLDAWWETQRVLIIHSGGDARRLPQYSLSGKLFSILPVTTSWGETSTVFDELLALSSTWAERLPSGLVVASGDVVPVFDPAALHWDRPGVVGVAMPESMAVGSRHGVYVTDEQGRVYAFLQKPTLSQVRDAGGMLPGDRVAVDTGIVRFDARISARLTELAGVRRHADGWQITPGILADTGNGLPVIDLYDHIMLALTGQECPPVEAGIWSQLTAAVRGVPFWCDIVSGEFTHIGTTPLFRRLMTEETSFSRLYQTGQLPGGLAPAGMRSAGVIIDSLLTGGGELGVGALAIECSLSSPVHAGHGAILHGLADLSERIEVPDNVVVHQVPVVLPDGQRGVVIRVYGVDDDPKGSVSAQTATWFGRPILEMLAFLGMTAAEVWPGLPPEEWTLWNARLFPVATPQTAWAYARWMFGLYSGVTSREWAQCTRLSLASSVEWADGESLARAKTHRMQEKWCDTAVSLARAGSDLRPLLAHPPGPTILASTGRALWSQAAIRRSSAPTEAASLYLHASKFLGQAGLSDDASRAYAMAFTCVQHGVDQQADEDPFCAAPRHWQANAATVSAPARIDFGGGWSDTPPFCLDWGGTVLNMAVTLRNEYPICARVRRLDEPVLRCVSSGTGETVEYRDAADVLAPSQPGSAFSLPRAALQLMGLVRPGETLAAALSTYGGGLEVTTTVHLPLGSGLGTSSILAAAVLRALAAMLGISLAEHALSDRVLRLEQRMATGGGWQDQVGGIYPGAKLTTSGPGLCQRLRVQPLAWSTEQQQEFMNRFILYYTGIRRIARNLLEQIVGRYLAREAEAVQVLHSIKTLAFEMGYAMCEGEWDYLGQLLDRHWNLNQRLDPHTSNAPINALLQEVRPYLAGAKLAGAGGGGYLMMLARSPEAARALRSYLAAGGFPGEVCDFAIASGGLQVDIE